jgi:hypothetical protein
MTEQFEIHHCYLDSFWIAQRLNRGKHLATSWHLRYFLRGGLIDNPFVICILVMVEVGE